MNNTLNYALECDLNDQLKEFREEFLFPPHHQTNDSNQSDVTTVKSNDSKCIYLCGNSLGLQPKGNRKFTHSNQLPLCNLCYVTVQVCKDI